MIPKPIETIYNLQPLSRQPWYKGVLAPPIGKFTHFFRDDKKDAFFFRTTAKDYDNDAVFDQLLSQIDSHAAGIDPAKITKTTLTGVESFDTLVFAPFIYTILPPSDYPDFDKKQVLVFPAYCYEVAGNESPKEFNIMLRSTLLTVNWMRTPSPKLKYRFKNPKHKYGTVGKSLVIDKESNVYAALGKFESDDCFMDVENSLQETANISFSKKNFIIRQQKEEKVLRLPELITYLELFFRQC